MTPEVQTWLVETQHLHSPALNWECDWPLGQMKDFSDPLGHALPFVKPSGQNILTQSDISNQLQLALSYFKVQQSCFMAIRANKNLEGGQQQRVRVLVLSNDVQVITSQKNEIVPVVYLSPLKSWYFGCLPGGESTRYLVQQSSTCALNEK